MSSMLHNLQIQYGSKKKRKRVGRGDASGHGTSSTRGIKGQKSRSGTGGFKRMGMKKILQSSPKFKGQKIRYPKMLPVNIETLEKHFEAGQIIDAKTLLKKNVINKLDRKIKILGNGDLKKKFTVIANAFSESAKEAILKAGGSIKIKNQENKKSRKQ